MVSGVMKAKLTVKSVNAFKPPKRKRYEVRDAVLPGLTIRVLVTGARVWYLCTRVDGRARKIKIGDYPVLSLANARERAFAVKRDIQLGTFDTEKAPALGEVTANFIELYAKQHTRDWQGTVCILTKFDKLKRKPINEITGAMS